MLILFYIFLNLFSESLWRLQAIWSRTRAGTRGGQGVPGDQDYHHCPQPEELLACYLTLPTLSSYIKRALCDRFFCLLKWCCNRTGTSCKKCDCVFSVLSSLPCRIIVLFCNYGEDFYSEILIFWIRLLLLVLSSQQVTGLLIFEGCKHFIFSALIKHIKMIKNNFSSLA